MIHPLDPPYSHTIAARLGRSFAAGTVTEAQAMEVITDAVDSSPHDRSGLRARLTWAFHDAAAQHRMDRSRAEFLIRRDARTAAQATPRPRSADILAGAHATNSRMGHPLTDAEAKDAVAAELTLFLARNRPKSRHG